MRIFARWLTVTSFVLAGLQVAFAQSERRVALVIGNAAYRAVAKLPNPTKDARDVAGALRAAAFTEVLERYDLGVREMQQALAAFEDKATGADWAVVYYAGHGIEVDGRNYLVPVDAELRRATDVEDETLALDRVLARVAAARKLQLVILDACRDNPFRARLIGARRTIGVRGLARIEPAQSNILVAYAARDGETALDGSAGGNSPYAKALLKHLAEPGLEVGTFFRKVRDDVLAETGGQQRPFEYGSLTGQLLYFKPVPVGSGQTAPPASAQLPPSPATQEWARVDKSSIAELETFERRHPSSPEAEYARARLTALRQSALATPPAPSVPLPIAPGKPFHTRSIKLVVPFAAGGGADVTARLVGAHMERTLGQPAFVENVAGVGGAIGTQRVADGPSDGHTVLVHTDGIVAAPESMGALEPVGLITVTPMVLVGRRGGPGSLMELLRTMKAGLSVANAGVGSSSHLCALALEQAIGQKLAHVPYRGVGPALSDLMGGQIDLTCSPPGSVAGPISAGQLQAYAVLGRARSPLLPDLPTTAEAGLRGLELASYVGLYVRKGTPPAAIAALNAALQRALADSGVADGLARQSMLLPDASMRSPSAHAQFLAADVQRKAPLLQEAGLPR